MSNKTALLKRVCQLVQADAMPFMKMVLKSSLVEPWRLNQRA
ncbi:hypothetical protein [Ligilactobacillus salitolerans]|nr:hypothetical protein [Ligilactobacillus salitolerans]